MAEDAETAWVKICGVRSLEQAFHAWRCGADAIGLNLYAPSPRSIDAPTARAIARKSPLPCYVVVVDPSSEDLRALNMAIQPAGFQLHGGQPLPGLNCLVAVRAGDPLPSGRFLLDARVEGLHGGTGVRVDEELARDAAAQGELILAGGLTPENVAGVIERVGPWGVDVASGVESAPGRQDPDRVREFIARAKGLAPDFLSGGV